MPYESKDDKARVTGAKNTRARDDKARAAGTRPTNGGGVGSHGDQLGRTMEYLGTVEQAQLRQRLAYLEGEVALLRSLLSAVQARDAAAEAVRQEAAKKSSGPGANPERDDMADKLRL